MNRLFSPTSGIFFPSSKRSFNPSVYSTETETFKLNITKTWRTNCQYIDWVNILKFPHRWRMSVHVVGKHFESRSLRISPVFFNAHTQERLQAQHQHVGDSLPGGPGTGASCLWYITMCACANGCVCESMCASVMLLGFFYFLRELCWLGSPIRSALISERENPVWGVLWQAGLSLGDRTHTHTPRRHTHTHRGNTCRVKLPRCTE